MGNENLFSDIEKQIQESIGNTATWSSNQNKWHKLRMRIKKTKTFPFIGSSNIRMPTVEIKLRKLKAALVNTIFGIRPIVNVVPSPSGDWDTAKKIEKFLDHLIMDVMSFKSKGIIAIDQALEKGFYLLKPFWRIEVVKREEKFDIKKLSIEELVQLFDINTKTEDIIQAIISKVNVDMGDMVAEDNLKVLDFVVKEILSGKDEVEFLVKDIIYDSPDVALVSPERVYVPTESGYDPQEAVSITHEFFLPLHQIKINAEEKGWNPEVIEDISALKGTENNKLTDMQKNTREGIERLNESNSLVRVWETYGWLDIDGNGQKVKAKVTSFPDFRKVARRARMDSFSGEYPFVKLFYELIDDRWFAHRGLGEILEDLVKEIDVQHNMKIDYQTMRNAPTIIYRAGMINPSNVGASPAQAIPVNGLNPLEDTIRVLNTHNPNVEFSYEREQQILQSQIEEMVGQIDFTLQSQINRREPRTLGEVQLQQQNANQVFSLDAAMFIEQFSKLFNMIFNLWSKLGSDEYEFNYFGDSTQGETIKLTKEEIQGKYTITVRGNDTNTNPQIKMQKAQQILMATTNPIYLQAGLVGPAQMAAGLRRFFKELEVENWEEYINKNPQQQEQSPADRIKMAMADLTESEQAQVLQSIGIYPDLEARGAKETRTAVKETAEAEALIGE